MKKRRRPVVVLDNQSSATTARLMLAGAVLNPSGALGLYGITCAGASDFFAAWHLA